MISKELIKMNTIVIGSFPINKLALARCYAIQRIFKDRNLFPPVKNNPHHETKDITELLNEPDIIQQWKLEYLQVPRPIDKECIELDYERYIKKFFGNSLKDT